MKFLLVLSVLVSVCCAADLLGVDKCTRGPSYWCSHIRAAKECGAVKHCKDNVWSMKYQKENDEVCDFCKEVIVTVRNLIANNATEQQITGFLKSACDLITDAELKLMCNTAVTEYAQELFDLIISELDPEVVCTAMGLCQPAMSNKMPDMKPILKKVPNADLCTECKTVITEAKQALADNKTREEILEVLEQLCQQLGPFEAECDDFMKQYIPQLLDLLEAQLDPEVICQALGFCSSVMKKKLILPSIELTPAKKMKNVDASVQCIVCEFAMQEIDKLITQNSSASEIISVVDKVCEILPSTIRGECKSFVDEYGPAIIQLLVQEVSPDKICSMLKLCMAVTLKADTECNLCKLVIQYADSVLIKNLTQQEIIKGLHDFCNVLPDNLKSQCNSIIDQYGSAIPALLEQLVDPLKICECNSIIDQYGSAIPALLEQLVDPLKICELLGLCGTTQTKSFPVLKKTKVVNASPTCALCEFVMQQLDQMLGQNATEAEIIAALDDVCARLPGSLAEECKSFVDEYGPAVIQLLVNELDPQKVCSVLGLCKGNTLKVPAKNDQECDLCKLLVQYLDSTLAKNATQQEIEMALKQICAVLPSELKDQCNSLVDQYGPILFQLLEQLATPDAVCKFIGLCQSSTKNVGLNKCTYGPSYWCANESNAMMCNAVEHCKNHVW